MIFPDVNRNKEVESLSFPLLLCRERAVGQDGGGHAFSPVALSLWPHVLWMRGYVTAEHAHSTAHAHRNVPLATGRVNTHKLPLRSSGVRITEPLWPCPLGQSGRNAACLLLWRPCRSAEGKHVRVFFQLPRSCLAYLGLNGTVRYSKTFSKLHFT